MQTDTADWVNKYSETLKQNVAYNKITKWVQCEDGTLYSPKENAVLRKTGNPVPLQVHLIKKVFEGTVIAAGN